MAFDAIATDAEAALQARARARYVELAAGLRQGAACDGAVEVLSRRGRLLAALADDLLATEPETARAMFIEGFEVLSVVAEQLDGAADAAAAARLQYELLDRAMYYEPHQPQAPRRRSCKVNSTGVCPRPKFPSKYEKPRAKPHDMEDRNQLRAYEVYARFGDDPERLRAVRYMLFHTLAEHSELGRELASVEAFIAEHDGHPLAAWAAFLLIDELTVRVTEGEERSVADLEALVRAIERLETMKLWTLDSAEELRGMVPIIQAGTSWQLALAARERGDYAECADRFLALFQRYDDHDRASELLLRASQCLAEDRRPDEAARVRRQLRERFPHSESARQAQ